MSDNSFDDVLPSALSEETLATPTQPIDAANTRCGFVALLGAPNAGKSTLLNQIVGEKVAIVTHKVQTTRSRIVGIKLHDDAQIIFVDTPGIFAPQKRLDRAMVQAAWSSAEDADIVSILVDVTTKDLTPIEAILDKVLSQKQRPILILNKIDLIPRAELLALAERLTKDREILHTFMISALTGDGVKDLLTFLSAHLPQCPWLYPENQVRDLPQQLFAAEITREKVLLNLHQEIPYAIAIETENWEKFKDGSLKIHQIIYVQKQGQKTIVLGKGGQKIKRIGADARKELENLFKQKIHLFLHVKVKENWMDRPQHYKTMGLEFDA